MQQPALEQEQEQTFDFSWTPSCCLVPERVGHLGNPGLWEYFLVGGCWLERLVQRRYSEYLQATLKNLIDLLHYMAFHFSTTIHPALQGGLQKGQIKLIQRTILCKTTQVFFFFGVCELVANDLWIYWQVTKCWPSWMRKWYGYFFPDSLSWTFNEISVIW